jgi:hypothetical protein
MPALPGNWLIFLHHTNGAFAADIAVPLFMRAPSAGFFRFA